MALFSAISIVNYAILAQVLLYFGKSLLFSNIIQTLYPLFFDKFQANDNQFSMLNNINNMIA